MILNSGEEYQDLLKESTVSMFTPMLTLLRAAPELVAISTLLGLTMVRLTIQVSILALKETLLPMLKERPMHG